MRKKTIGIGVAGIVVLLLSVATLVPVTATPTLAETISTPETDLDFEAIDELLLKYKDDLVEIDAHIEDYIAEYGAIDENFVLPEDLQMKFDNIVAELSTRLGEIGSLGGGRTGFKFSYQWWGFKLWVYLSHYWTNVLNWLGPAGATAVAALLCAISGGYLAPIAILAASIMLAMGIDYICDKDRGRGVGVYVQYSWIWFIPTGGYAWSQ